MNTTPTKPVTAKAKPVKQQSTKDLPTTGLATIKDLESHTKQLKRQVSKLSQASPEKLCDPITELCSREKDVLALTTGMAALARLHKWAIGKLLISAKDKLKHGMFQVWIEENFEFSKSSAENYMKLARDYPDADDFLENDTPLRELYTDPSDVTDDLTDSDASRDKGECPSKVTKLLRSVTQLQQHLRKLSDLSEPIAEAELTQLKLAKKEIDQFFSSILKQNPAKQ